MVKAVIVFLVIFCGAVTFFVLKPSPNLVRTESKTVPSIQIAERHKGEINSVHLKPNPLAQSFETKTLGLSTFAGKPLEKVDHNKYRNIFNETVLKEGRLFQWYRSNLTYSIDKATQRRITKSKVKRAFEHWAKESQIFTFREVDNQADADIIIQVATASEKDRMGEAGPDQAYENGTITINGYTLTKYIIKHAKITIASDFFDYDKLKEYQKAQSDQGFQTLVHELGHVLGIMGHSSQFGDCMYSQAHPSGKACDELIPEVNTLAMIYGRENALTRGFYSQKRF